MNAPQAALASLDRATRRRFDDLVASIERLEEYAPPVLSLLAGELMPLLDADADASYRPDLSKPGEPFDFVYLTGHLAGIKGFFGDFLRRSLPSWTPFQPEWIDPRERNRSMTLDDIVRLNGAALSDHNPFLHELYPRAGIVQNIRALITEGPVLLAWVGVSRSDRRLFRPEQQALLQALVPSLHGRLRTERLLGDQRLTMAAFAPLLEAISAPALLVDAKAHVHHANHAGVAWLDADVSSARAALGAALRGKAAGLDVTPLRAVGMAPRWLVVVRRHRRLSEDRLHQAAARWRLTPRQRQVLALLAEGQANKTIAARLGIEENTVEVHVSAILRKAQVDSRASLIAAFLRG